MRVHRPNRYAASALARSLHSAKSLVITLSDIGYSLMFN